MNIVSFISKYTYILILTRLWELLTYNTRSMMFSVSLLLIVNYCHSLLRLICFYNLPIQSRAIRYPYNIMLTTIIINNSFSLQVCCKT